MLKYWEKVVCSWPSNVTDVLNEKTNDFFEKLHATLMLYDFADENLNYLQHRITVQFRSCQPQLGAPTARIFEKSRRFGLATVPKSDKRPCNCMRLTVSSDLRNGHDDLTLHPREYLQQTDPRDPAMMNVENKQTRRYLDVFMMSLFLDNAFLHNTLECVRR